MDPLQESAIKREVAISIHRRPDGGLRVTSKTLPGLILSGANPDAVADMIGPAIKALLEHRGEWPEWLLPGTALSDSRTDKEGA